MPKNYDPSTGLPYTRTDKIVIYYQPDHIIVTLTEGQSIFAGNSVFKLDASDSEYQFRIGLDQASLTKPYPKRDFSTGAVVEGQTTVAEAILNIFAITRAAQLERDAAQL